MSYVHPFSKRCDKSEIDLFSVPPTQQSLERGRWIDYAPLSSVENPDSAITYLIAGTDEYIDLSKTILTVTGKILMGDGKTDLSGGNQTSVAPVNNFLHSLFKQVDVYLNGKQVTPAMGTYAYRAYIETLLNYDASAKKSQFTSALYYKSSDLLSDLPQNPRGVSWRVDVAWGPRKRKREETLTLVHAGVYSYGIGAWGPRNRETRRRRNPRKNHAGTYGPRIGAWGPRKRKTRRDETLRVRVNDKV